MRNFYVYTLTNSLTGSVFYVGKGTGYRMQSHISNACRGQKKHTPAEQTIRSIWEQGGRVIMRKPYKNLTDMESLRLEKMLIVSYGYEQLVNQEWSACHQNQWSPPKGKRNGW